MYICMCNPFSEKKVREHLKSTNGTARVADVYSCCSNGEKPRCCSCIQTLKDMVQSHNNTVAA